FTETVVRHSREAQPADSAADSGDDSPASAGDCTNAQILTWAEALTQAEAEIGVDRDRASGRKKDRAAGRRQRRIRKRAQEIIDNPPPLPDFPGFDPRLTFFTWLRGNIEASEVGVYSSLLGATTSTSLKHLTSSMTLAHGLPRFLRRCVDGDFTIEHVAYVTRRCRDLRFEHFPAIDDFLAARRADITIETFKRSLARKIAGDSAARGHPEERRPPPPRRRRHRRRRNGLPDPDRARSRAPGVLQASRSIRSSRVQGQHQCVLRPAEDRRLLRRRSRDLGADVRRPHPHAAAAQASGHQHRQRRIDEHRLPARRTLRRPDGVPMHEGESLLDYIERVFDDLDKNQYLAQPTSVSPTGTAGSAAENSESAAGDSRRVTPADRVFESQILE